MAAEVGSITENQQKLLDKTAKPGTDHMQHVWIVRCMRESNGAMCDHIYGANSSDFARRRCPKCDGGAAGLELP